ncbi:MAG: group III truncated hemoglobin [Henriciella sp.]
MTATRIRSAHERRQEIQARAAALGIDEAFIDHMVEVFYQRVRAHTLLGPIFEEQIAGNWDPHLATMKAFWASVAMNTGQYSGKPVPAHRKISGVEPGHFDIWLGLFEATLNELTSNRACVDYFMERAERIARSLKLAIFGIPALGAPA